MWPRRKMSRRFWAETEIEGHYIVLKLGLSGPPRRSEETLLFHYLQFEMWSWLKMSRRFWVETDIEGHYIVLKLGLSGHPRRSEDVIISLSLARDVIRSKNVASILSWNQNWGALYWPQNWGFQGTPEVWGDFIISSSLAWDVILTKNDASILSWNRNWGVFSKVRCFELKYIILAYFFQPD